MIPSQSEPAFAADPTLLSDTNFSLLVDSVRDYGIFMLSPVGVVLSWNKGAENILGYRPEEIVGHNFRCFYPAEDAAAGRPDNELSTAASTGRYEEEGWRLRKDGSRFRAHVVVTALRDPDGKLRGFAKVTQDVTERYRAEQALRESEERFRVLVEQITDYAIFMLDAQGRVSTWNRGAERIKGYRAEEVLGKPLALFYTPEDRAVDRTGTLIEHARTAGVAHTTGWRVRKDGSRFWADVTLTALHDKSGRLYGYAKVVRDLTDRVEAEEQAKAYAAAKEAIEARDEFLSIASHELRTPLAAALLHLQGLNRQVARPLETWNAQRLALGVKLALDSGRHLSALVERLLDVSRIATGRIQLELSEFDLAAVTAEVVDHLRPFGEQFGCRLVMQPSAAVVGQWDRLRIEQALTNLITNACKYAPGTDVEIVLAQEGERVRLSVRDQGPGIEPEHAERIFERFERAVSSSNYGGLGLGLYVTRQIAEVHGGSIRVESEKGQGSLFIIELPRHAAV